jgi:hypothetical protein
VAGKDDKSVQNCALVAFLVLGFLGMSRSVANPLHAFSKRVLRTLIQLLP